jgi:hypothetical protein
MPTAPVTAAAALDPFDAAKAAMAIISRRVPSVSR